MADTSSRKLQVRTVPLDELIPLEGNVRVHSERNVAAIRDSLARFGQVAPLVVRDGTNQVIGGNGTLEAMRALGWTSCRIVRVDVGGDEEAHALALALNRSAELGAWDPGALASLLDGLQTSGWPLDELGWTDQELAALWQDAIVPEEAPPPESDETGGADGELGRPIYLTASQREAFDNAVKRFRAELGEASEGNIISLFSLHFIDCDLTPFR